MELWIAWYQTVAALRPACARTRTLLDKLVALICEHAVTPQQRLDGVADGAQVAVGQDHARRRFDVRREDHLGAVLADGGDEHLEVLDPFARAVSMTRWQRREWRRGAPLLLRAKLRRLSRGLPLARALRERNRAGASDG